MLLYDILFCTTTVLVCLSTYIAVLYYQGWSLRVFVSVDEVSYDAVLLVLVLIRTSTVLVVNVRNERVSTVCISKCAY